VALERLAARDQKSVAAVLAWELRDLVSAQSEWLASVIPIGAGRIERAARRVAGASVGSPSALF